MEEPVTAKSSFDSFDQDFLSGFDFKNEINGKMGDAEGHCASTQACTDYQKVIIQKELSAKVKNMNNFRT